MKDAEGEEGQDFGYALRLVKTGSRARRRDWALPRNWWIELHAPGPSSDVDWPYLVKMWSDGWVPWAPTQADLLAEDWEQVPASAWVNESMFRSE
jgi:hypothetical protein